MNSADALPPPERPRIVFYCITDRDRVLAEEIGAKLDAFKCFYVEEPFGDHPFAARPELGPAQPHADAGRRGGRSNLKTRLWAWAWPRYRKFRSALRDARRAEKPAWYVGLAWRTAQLPGIQKVLRLINWLFHTALWRWGAYVLIDRFRPHAIVLFEENVEGWSRPLATAAAARDVPYVIIPQTIPNPAEPAQFYFSSRDHAGDRLLASILLRFLPDWGYVHRGRRLIRLPVVRILFLKLMRIAPPTPWILNSGKADAICVECEELRRIHLALGFHPSQLAVSGHPVDDTLHRISTDRVRRLKDLEAALALPPGRPLVVVGFPPNQYASPDISPFESPDFKAMCETWKCALDELRDHANVVIRPHPRLTPEDLRIFADAGYPVLDQPTETLVPLADLYIASISATIRWALALGIPVINYDCYRYRYGDYEKALGVTTVETSEAFRATLRDFVQDPDFVRRLREGALKDRRTWGLIDGRSVDRFAAVLSGCVSERTSREWMVETDVEAKRQSTTIVS